MIEEQLRKSIRMQRKSQVLKLINPGVHKFITRLINRLNNKGKIKRINLFFGEKMYVVLPEIVSETIYTYGYFDEIVSWFAINNIKPGNIVIDIGAHFGYFSLLFSKLVGTAGCVYSFEPTPSTFNILLKNCKNRNNIFPINAAVGEEKGELIINDYGLINPATKQINTMLKYMHGKDRCTDTKSG
ncbi:MAG: FkbM family methyltransferase, partial [Thermodesulfovibrionales bacterium]